MRTTLIAVVAGALSLPAFVMAADASPHAFTGNAGLVSNYVFRGISQSGGKAALQGGFDYAHASGLYAGTWASNVNWVTDNYGGTGLPSASNSLEIDVYGGYKGAITDDVGFDVGLITYNYPGSNTTVGGTFLKPDTTEVYGALSWKWLTVKYSHSTTALFGWGKTSGALNKTSGSGYLEINGAFDLGDGWGINAHVGDQKIKGNGPASYTDYKLGVSKDAGYGVFGLAVTGSSSNGSCTAGAPTNAAVDVYCWGTAPGKSAYDAGKSAVVLSFSKAF
ncbi:MAG: TorF family putative porin [Burkholderiaceae bacterium]|nr:TorF family putative porin [Burkholderiaceae bacterium]MCF8183376.1 TorF family putative porin [Polynucleobacter sp.]